MNNDQPSPLWACRPVVVDADLSEQVPWPAVRGAGYSHKFQLQAPIGLTHVSYSERPQYLYVTGDSSHSVHTFWFPNAAGTAEFDIINGRLEHLDSLGCSVSISGTELIFGPHQPGKSRMNMGGRRDVPRNSEELFMAVMRGYRPESAD